MRQTARTQQRHAQEEQRQATATRSSISTSHCHVLFRLAALPPNNLLTRMMESWILILFFLLAGRPAVVLKTTNVRASTREPKRWSVIFNAFSKRSNRLQQLVTSPNHHRQSAPGARIRPPSHPKSAPSCPKSTPHPNAASSRIIVPVTSPGVNIITTRVPGVVNLVCTEDDGEETRAEDDEETDPELPQTADFDRHHCSDESESNNKSQSLFD